MKRRNVYNPNQIALPFTGHFNSAKNIINYSLRTRILNMLLISITTLFSMYILFLGNIVFNIIERKDLEAKIRILTNEVGNLELLYLSASNKIDVNLGNLMGFKEAKKVKFVNRSSSFPSNDTLQSISKGF